MLLATRYFLVSKRKGFTLVELLIFSAIFVIIMISFITVFITITRIGTGQSSAAEVNQQSQFLLQQIQYYVEQSSLVELDRDSSTSTLKLRMSASSTDPTYLYLSNDTAYVKRTDAGLAVPLTTNKVKVTAFNFTKHSNPPAHDSVSVSFTVAYNTSNPEQQFTQSINTAITRITSAVFDANVLPTSTATYHLGVTGNMWKSINGIIYFSSANVGIGVSSPAQTLEVNGGVRLNTAMATSTCASALRGTFWVHLSASTKADNVQVCAKQASGDTYGWRTIY
jgi:competence protein ComGC